MEKIQMRKTILVLFYSVFVASLFACSSMPKVEGVAEPNKIWTKEGLWRNITALNKEKLFATKQDGFSREYYIVNASNGQMEKVELNSEKTY
ncbi:MAG TPA: hypothetical protein PK293_18490, partial [Spirochaetota bacterium]|nr:hypothetical protein [Spirochaetota bacterium]